MGALLGRLDHHESQLRGEFCKRFRAFASEDHQTEYRSLFRPAEPSAEGAPDQLPETRA
jgi:hypothetical protein